MGRPWLFFLALGVVAALALMSRWLGIGIFALIVAAALNRYNFDVLGWQMKVEHMALLVVLLAWTSRILAGKDRSRELPFAFLLVALLGAGLVSSLLNSPDVYKSFRILTRMALAVLAFWLIVSYITDAKALRRATAAYLLTGAAAAAYGIIALALWYWAGKNIGVQFNSFEGSASPYGTLWEGNIFGSYVMSVALVSLGLLLSGARTFDRRLLALVFGLTATAMLLSLARAPWVGFGLGVILTLFLTYKLRPTVLLQATAGIVLALILVLQFNPAGIPDVVSARFDTLTEARQHVTVRSRVAYTELAIEEWQRQPWFGSGIDGFHIRHPEILSALPSPQLNVLYDTGLVGLAFFVAFVAWFVVRSGAVALTAKDSALGAMLRALLISFLGLLVAFQATDAFWLMFPWIQMALIAGAVALIRARARAAPPADAHAQSREVRR